MARYAQRLIREKLEVTPGTAVVTAPADAILARNVTLRNLDADYQRQDFARGVEGAQGEDVYNVNSGAEYDVEAACGITTTVPAYAHLLQSSGMAMTDDDGDTVFTPLIEGAAIPTTTMQLRNGAVLQNVVGVRGSCSFTAENGRKPFFRFNRRGRYTAPVEFVAADHAFGDWPRALTANPENMFAFTLGGQHFCVSSFNFSDGRTPVVDAYMNCEGTTLSPRNFTGAMTVKWPALATKDLLTQIKNGVTEPLIWTLGKTAGQTIQISAPKVQIKFAGEQEINGDLGITLDLIFLPDATGTDIAIRFS